ncbi:nucleotidyltransferase family protein [Arcobacter sp. F2176]|uniref:nucleotidyltransferase family protein n=1 Tax=Arcobacter sp. F2176 TaxID=2044511 RepID=UPI00100A2EEC|nr:nucleotidyltransferase domain-containing protein [Arcobacter sp. F2176]RXJ80515.1 nucleotidyltransferase [Arcobacter sp. F2176]
MDNQEVFENLKAIKQTLINDGFIIDGIFGSYARNENLKDSDVDILYHLDKVFYDKYSGFIGFKKLDEIKEHISKSLGKKIDLAPKTNLSKTAKKYILNDVIYV